MYYKFTLTIIIEYLCPSGTLSRLNRYNFWNQICHGDILILVYIYTDNRHADFSRRQNLAK